MKQAATFSSWNLATTGGSSSVWRIYEGNSGPLLRGFLTALNVSDATLTYNAAMQAGVAVPTSGNKTGTAASGANAGTYAAWSNQQGYDITGGLLVINPFAVSLSGARVYDGSTNVAASAVTMGPLAGGQTLNLSGTGSILDKNVGNGKAVTGFTLADGTGLASNYTFIGGTQQLDVTPKSLTYTTTAASKVYDGTDMAQASLALSGMIGAETLAATANATFNGKDVATADRVTVNSITLADGSNGGLAGNYTVTSGGSAAAHITANALTVVAKDDIRLSGTPYSGGNGVSYNGLVSGETAASVLTGNLSYGGNSQGASGVGQYAITPQGLQANGNYSLGFTSGILTLIPSAAITAAFGTSVQSLASVLGISLQSLSDGYRAALISIYGVPDMYADLDDEDSPARQRFDARASNALNAAATDDAGS